MPLPSPQDKRGFFFLPQYYEGGGYYTYGSPRGGLGQYAHPQMHSFLMLLAHAWTASETRRFGVGNISLAEGEVFLPHKTHRDGLGVDIRPLRKDGKQAPVSFRSADYDRAGTTKLVSLMWNTGYVRRVLFNDASVPNVRSAIGHDDHLHIDVVIK